MIARSRFLPWLMWPVLALCSFAVSANSPDGASQALHLIDYIGADYPPTVEDGHVIDETEYHEQLEFLGVLKGLIAELPERPSSPPILLAVSRCTPSNARCAMALQVRVMALPASA